MASARYSICARLSQLTPKSRSYSLSFRSPITRAWTCGQCSHHITQSSQNGLRRTFYSSSGSDESHTTHTHSTTRDVFAPLDTFAHRHIGPSPHCVEQMLKALNPPVKTLDEFVKQV